jgi:hypothetical protein
MLFNYLQNGFAHMSLLGLADRRVRWGLTLRGWIVLLLILIACGGVGVYGVVPFLAPTAPVTSDVLIVEGWIPDYAFKEAVEEFKRGGYKMMLTTGGPMTFGSSVLGYGTYAAIAAAIVRRFGLDSSQVFVVAAPASRRDRTFMSAVALRRWCADTGVRLTSANLFSFSVHARRSRMMFERALGDSVKIGVIAAADVSYGPGDWWKSSNGVRDVLPEAIAYVYALFFSFAVE